MEFKQEKEGLTLDTFEGSGCKNLSSKQTALVIWQVIERNKKGRNVLHTVEQDQIYFYCISITALNP